MQYKVNKLESPYYGQVLELAFKWDDADPPIPGYYALHRPDHPGGVYSIDVEWLELIKS